MPRVLPDRQAGGQAPGGLSTVACLPGNGHQKTQTSYTGHSVHFAHHLFAPSLAPPYGIPPLSSTRWADLPGSQFDMESGNATCSSGQWSGQVGWWADLSGQGGLLLLVAAPAASSGDPPEIEPHCTALHHSVEM